MAVSDVIDVVVINEIVSLLDTIGDCERLRKEAVGKTKLREEFKSFQDAKARRFEQKSAELDAHIADVRRDMDNDMYPYMFTSIAGRRWLLSHGVRLAVMQCAQSAECQSALVEAYNLGVKDYFVSAITDFDNVSFSLLDELELLKDSPLASIMSALVLKDAQGNVVSTSELQRFQPSLDQVIIPIYSESGSVSGEVLQSEVIPIVRAAAERRGLCPPPLVGASGSVPLPGSSLGVGGSATQPPIVQTHDDLFDTSVLDGAGDCERLRKEAVGETKLREELKSFQDAEARRFEQKSAELDARIADVRRDMDNDMYHHMFTSIVGRRWLLSHGVCLAVMKCAQSAKCQLALVRLLL
ncbi:hypothetical protein Tco_1480127 [Tanacetum coccineum]